MTTLPLLSILILLPLCGAVLCALCPPEAGRRLALGVALAELVLSLVVVAAFDPALPDFQLVERYGWIAGLNMQFLLGIDGISLLFLPLTALLTVVVLIHAWPLWPQQQGLFAALLLVLAPIAVRRQ
jgi:NADH-quinone oxidoreductase subunit M